MAFGGLALAVSTLVLGGVYRWTQAIVAGLVGLALITQLGSRRKLDRLSPIVLLLLLAIGMTALQLVPLPSGLVHALEPASAATRDDGAALAGTSPWPCLAMDFAATLRALMYLVTLLGVALISLRLAAADRGRFVLLGGVAIACGLVAAVTGIHSIVSAKSIYGLYSMPYDDAPVIGPFVNLNHLGCLMSFGAILGFGLAFYERQSASWRALWVVVAVGCTAISLLSESRGAAVGLIVGILVTGALLLSRKLGDVARRRSAFSTGRLPIVVVLVVGFGLAVYSSAGGVAEQLGKTSMADVDHPTSKFAAWRASVKLIEESPWVGVGRGSVEPVLTHAFPSTAYATFGHLENEYIEAVVDFGIPGAIVLAVALAWCVFVGLRKWRDGPLAAAALGALAAVMFQSSVDFGVELLGVAVPVVIVASTLQLVPLRETSRFGALRASRVAMILALGTAVVVLLSDHTTTLDEDHDAMLAGKYKTREQLAPILERHPLDYFAFGILGQQMIVDRDPRASAFLDHALRLHPYQPGLHRFAARLLIGTGRREQGALEYRLALASSNRPHLLLKEILFVLPDAEEASSAIPLDYPDPDSILRSLNELKRQDVSERWLVRRALDRTSHDTETLDTLYNLAMARADYPVALRAATVRGTLMNTPTSRYMTAKVRFAQKAYPEVYALLADVETWRGRLDERADAWLLRCDSFRAEMKWDDALKCLHMLDATSATLAHHDEIVKRIADVNDHRAAELRTKQIQNMERSLGLPVDGDLPVIQGGGSTEAIPNPLGSAAPITNPIRNPLSAPATPNTPTRAMNSAAKSGH